MILHILAIYYTGILGYCAYLVLNTDVINILYECDNTKSIELCTIKKH